MKARAHGSFRHARRPKCGGCGLAFAVLALVLAGMIGVGWLAVVAVLYARRWLKAPRRPPVQRHADDSLATPKGRGPEPTLQRLDRLVAQARPHLPDELVVHLYSVRCSIAQALPWLVQGPAHEADLYTVRETVRRYLPDTLAHYFAVPPALRDGPPMTDGRTARQLLAQQLALLDEEMRAIASKVASGDAQALLANGRFLEARFGRPDFASG